jgi:hypothetical protein
MDNFISKFEKEISLSSYREWYQFEIGMYHNLKMSLYFGCMKLNGILFKYWMKLISKRTAIFQFDNSYEIELFFQTKEFTTVQHLKEIVLLRNKNKALACT